MTLATMGIKDVKEPQSITKRTSIELQELSTVTASNSPKELQRNFKELKIN